MDTHSLKPALPLLASIAWIALAAPVQANDVDAVQAELGGLPAPELSVTSRWVDVPADRAAASIGVSRAEVAAEFIRARDAGELDWAYVEAYQLPLGPRGVVQPRPMQMARAGR